MNILKLCFVVGIVSMLCQGCASTPGPDGKGQGRAKLVDLGNGICRQSNGLMWQVERTKMLSSDQEALAYVDSLNLGNHSDWRLPTKDELYDLCYIFEMKLAGDCPIKLKGSYWSTNGGTKAGEWHAYPLCGGSELQYIKSKSGRVRAVRP